MEGVFVWKLAREPGGRCHCSENVAVYNCWNIVDSVADQTSCYRRIVRTGKRWMRFESDMGSGWLYEA